MPWILFVALGLGLRHAIAPDHLAAVGTFVEKTHATRRQGARYAIRIAAGHALGMVAVAGLLMGLLLSLPSGWMRWTDWGTGLWLLTLAIWILWDFVRDLARTRGAGGPDPGAHEAVGSAKDRTRTDPPRRQGGFLERPVTGWLVGLLFGIAVSPGDLAIFTIMTRQHATPLFAFGLLALFFLAMFAGLGALGGGLGSINARRTVHQVFLALSGVSGIAVALALITGALR